MKTSPSATATRGVAVVSASPGFERSTGRRRLHVPKGERPAVWFTCKDTWEPTVGGQKIDQHGRVQTMTLEDLQRVGGGLFRLEVPDSIPRHTWAHHLRCGGVDLRDARELERRAREWGSDPNEWRVSYHDVPLSRILAVEAGDPSNHWSPVGKVEDGVLVLDEEVLATISTAAQKSRMVPLGMAFPSR